MDLIKSAIIDFSQTQAFLYLFIFFILCFAWQVFSAITIKCNSVVSNFISLFLRYCIFIFLIYVGTQGNIYTVSAIVGFFFVITLNYDNNVRYENAIVDSIYKQIGKK